MSLSGPDQLNERHCAPSIQALSDSVLDPGWTPIIRLQLEIVTEGSVGRIETADGSGKPCWRSDRRGPSPGSGPKAVSWTGMAGGRLRRHREAARRGARARSMSARGASSADCRC